MCACLCLCRWLRVCLTAVSCLVGKAHVCSGRFVCVSLLVWTCVSVCLSVTSFHRREANTCEYHTVRASCMYSTRVWRIYACVCMCVYVCVCSAGMAMWPARVCEYVFVSEPSACGHVRAASPSAHANALSACILPEHSGHIAGLLCKRVALFPQIHYVSRRLRFCHAHGAWLSNKLKTACVWRKHNIQCFLFCYWKPPFPRLADGPI